MGFEYHASRKFPLDALRRAGGPVFRAVCKSCGAKREIDFVQTPPPDVVLRKFTQAGWTLGKAARCPACVGGRAAAGNPQPFDRGEMKDMPETEAPAAPARAGKIHRQTILALEDYYDEQAKAFRPGRSDKSIADEIDTSEAFVRKIREEYFGPLAQPSQLAAISARIDKAANDLTALRADYAALCKKNGWV